MPAKPRRPVHLLAWLPLPFLIALPVCPARATCNISGPNIVVVGAQFTLCADGCSDSCYTWTGPNLTDGTHARCISVSGLGTGTYEYRLTIREDGRSETCATFQVTVEDGPPPPTCEISGPTVVALGEAFSLCGAEGKGYTYSWYDANGALLTHERCAAFPGGILVAGEYEYQLEITQGSASLKCPAHVSVRGQGPKPH